MKREAARFMVGKHRLSTTRACRCVGVSRSGFYRVSRHWTGRDADVIAAVATLVEGRSNRGFWKCRKCLKRQGRPGVTRRFTACIVRWDCTYAVRQRRDYPNGSESLYMCRPTRTESGRRTLSPTHGWTEDDCERSTLGMTSTAK